MPDYEIVHDANNSSGRYTIQLAPDTIAELSYHRVGDDLISIDHTRVPEAFRGRKIAEKLLLRAITDAREDRVRVIPVCSYVDAQFRRHPEWGDLLAK